VSSVDGGTASVIGGGSLNGAPLAGGFTFRGPGRQRDILQSGALSVSNLGTLTVGDEPGGLGHSLHVGRGRYRRWDTYLGVRSTGGGAGSFLQSGGSSNLGSGLISAKAPPSTGVASLSGGSLTAASTFVGYLGGSGTFLQTASNSFGSLGTVTVGSAGTIALSAARSTSEDHVFRRRHRQRGTLAITAAGSLGTGSLTSLKDQRERRGRIWVPVALSCRTRARARSAKLTPNHHSKINPGQFDPALSADRDPTARRGAARAFQHQGRE